MPYTRNISDMNGRGTTYGIRVPTQVAALVGWTDVSQVYLYIPPIDDPHWFAVEVEISNKHTLPILPHELFVGAGRAVVPVPDTAFYFERRFITSGNCHHVLAFPKTIGNRIQIDVDDTLHMSLEAVEGVNPRSRRKTLDRIIRARFDRA